MAHGVAWDFAESLTYGHETYIIQAPSDTSFVEGYSEYYRVYVGDISDNGTVISGTEYTVTRASNLPYLSYRQRSVAGIHPDVTYASFGHRAYQTLENELYALTPQLQAKYSAVALCAVFLSAVIFAITFSSVRILRR